MVRTAWFLLAVILAIFCLLSIYLVGTLFIDGEWNGVAVCTGAAVMSFIGLDQVIEKLFKQPG